MSVTMLLRNAIFGMQCWLSRSTLKNQASQQPVVTYYPAKGVVLALTEWMSFMSCSI